MQCTSRGLTDVKGRGLMETFDVSVDQLARQVHALRRGSDGSAADVAVVGMGALDLESLSPETLGQWAVAGAGPGRWARFADPAVEEELARAAAGTRRQGLGLGLGLHWILVAMQWLQVSRPEHGYGFRPGGPDGLVPTRRRGI